jgi:hypothetical protein
MCITNLFSIKLIYFILIMQVLAVTRLKSMSKMSIGSSSATEAREVVNDIQDGINIEDTPATRHGSSIMPDHFPIDKSFDTTPPALGETSELPRFGSKELPEFEDDEDLKKAVRKKISELEEQNKALNTFLSGRKDVRQLSLPIISFAESARAKTATGSSSDEEAAPPRFADTQAVTSRLTLEKNLATIKSLQLNLLE